MDEVIKAIQSRYGQEVVIHWEDVGSRHSFNLLRQLRDAGVTTFNDDIECTAAITVAALLGAVRIPGVVPLPDQRVLFFGAGQANLGCASLLMAAMKEEGLTEQEAKSRLWLMDRKGLLLQSRTDLSPEKQLWAQDPSFLGMAPGSAPPVDLQSIVEALKPTTLIGAASVGGAFTRPIIQAMAQARPGGAGRPVVLALSNPTDKAEITYRDAYDWSDGRVVYASGTRFAPLQVDSSTGRVMDSTYNSSIAPEQISLRIPSQCNNCYVFPGIGMGCIASGAADMTEGMLLAAARAVAGSVSSSDLFTEQVLPPISQLIQVTQTVAAAVASAAAVDMVATTRNGGLGRMGKAACAAVLAGAGQVQERTGQKLSLRDCLDGITFTARKGV